MLKLQNGNAVIVFGLTGDYDSDIMEWIQEKEDQIRAEGLDVPKMLNVLLSNAIRKGIRRGA